MTPSFLDAKLSRNGYYVVNFFFLYQKCIRKYRYIKRKNDNNHGDLILNTYNRFSIISSCNDETPYLDSFHAVGYEWEK